jgi:hypothetical protein
MNMLLSKSKEVESRLTVNWMNIAFVGAVNTQAPTFRRRHTVVNDQLFFGQSRKLAETAAMTSTNLSDIVAPTAETASPTTTLSTNHPSTSPSTRPSQSPTYAPTVNPTSKVSSGSSNLNSKNK